MSFLDSKAIDLRRLDPDFAEAERDELNGQRRGAAIGAAIGLTLGLMSCRSSSRR